MIRLAALSSCEAASALSKVIPSFRRAVTATSALLSLSLVSVGVLAQLSSPSGSGYTVATLSTHELEADDYRPLVQGALLFSSFDGLALDLVMDKKAPVVSVLNSSGREVRVANGDTHIRFDLIPEQENIGVLCLDREGTALYDLLVMSSNIAYDPKGQLVNAVLPETLDHNQGVYLGATLEALLKVLADDEQQLLKRLRGQGRALLNVSADHASLTIYSEGHLVKALFKAEIDRDDHHQVVVLDPDWERQSELNTRSDYLGGALRLVAVLENNRGSVSSVAMNYLRDVVDGIDKEKMKTHLGQLGHVGEVGLNLTPSFAERPRWQTHFRSLPESSALLYQLSGTLSHREIVRAVHGILQRVRLTNIQPVIAIEDGLYQELLREWGHGAPDHPYNRHLIREHGLGLSDLFDRGILVCTSRLAEDVQPYQIHFGSSNWLIRYLSDHSEAVLRGMAVGGAVQTGLDIYQEYQSSGRLPYKYTEQEKEALVNNALAGALRGAFSASASFNLISGLGVPSIVAGAIVGSGNSLYDSHSQGRLTRGNAGNILVRTGTASAVASAGSIIGAGIGSAIPLPLSQTTGALAGSLIGHYIYSYVEDNYDTIKDTIKDSFERSYQADQMEPGLWM